MTTAQELTLQKSTEEIEVFQPSKGMMKWFEVAVELGHTAAITDIAKKAKLDRDNWYQWLERPQFVEWWDNMWKRYITLNRWKLDAIGMKKAETDYQYWHDMMERMGNIQRNSEFAEEATYTWRKK